MSSSKLISSRGRHVGLFALAALGLSAVASRGVDGTASDRSSALARSLARRGLVAQGSDVAWADSRGSVWGAFGGVSRAFVRAATAPSEPSDMYLVEARLSPDGVLIGVGDIFNVSETTAADESPPVVRGTRVAYISKPFGPGAPSVVRVLDLAMQPDLPKDWTRLERTQNALSNFQQTGRLPGLSKQTLVVDPPADHGDAPVGIALDVDTLVVRSAGREARVALSSREPGKSLPPWVRMEDAELARPGNLVTWAVDRVRAVPWIGDEKMQLVKAVAFTALDFVQRNREHVTGDTGAADIAADLGQNKLDPTARSIPVDPEIGWPPAPLEPWVTPALPGEGAWNPQDHDPFVRTNEGLPPAFLTTFIRSDRDRRATRVYVALWDPRQIELHMMAGTVEPKGATGEAGPGLIPRTPEVMRRVVAASNAGFQALHGEFGMMADGVVYLPPKPYAATVAELRDGSTAFGSWPEDVSIPDNVLSYRQNMTVMVLDQKFNPYHRVWWGGTPPGWADKTHTVRTGMCLTKEQFVAYFYGADIGPEALAQAMIQTRCSFGLALDMNAGHSGLEFYKVAPAEELGSLGRPLETDWEGEGDVPGIDGYRFRARRLIRGMGLMNFPRYIKRESRDFFYMTLRHVLPGPSIAPTVQPPRPEEGTWRLKGLPQHGFPYALALTSLRVDPAHPEQEARVLAIDPRTVRAAPASSPAGGKVVAVVESDASKAGGETVSIWHSSGAFSVAPTAPVPDAVRIATGHASGAGVAALGVEDEGGMLVYVELPVAAAANGHALEELLKRLGCSSRVVLDHPLRVALGGDTDLGGVAVRAPSGAGAVRLDRVDAANGRRLFESTPIVPYDTWYPLQQKRIRYFKKAPGAAEPSGDGSGQ